MWGHRHTETVLGRKTPLAAALAGALRRSAFDFRPDAIREGDGTGECEQPAQQPRRRRRVEQPCCPEPGDEGEPTGDECLDEPLHGWIMGVGQRECIGRAPRPPPRPASFVVPAPTVRMADARLVFDDDCGFCTWWAEFIADRADVELVGFSALDPELRERLPEEYQDCSHFVTDEHVYSCGESIEEGLLRSDLGTTTRPVFDRLRGSGAYTGLREWGYRNVTHNRRFWGRLFSKRPPAREREEEPTTD